MMARMVGGLTGTVVLLLPRGTRLEAAPASWSRSTRRGGRAPVAPYVLLSSMACPSLSGNVTWYAKLSLRGKDNAYAVKIDLTAYGRQGRALGRHEPAAW